MIAFLKPEQFLAIAFDESGRSRLSYDILTMFRNELRKYDIEVEWHHDEVNFAFGFYDIIFTRAHDGVKCKTGVLRDNLSVIIGHLSDDVVGKARKVMRDVLTVA